MGYSYTHLSHKDRQAHYMQHKTHMHHHHNFRTVFVWANKEGGWLEDIFMQTVPVQAAQLPKLRALDGGTEATQYKGSGCQEGEGCKYTFLTGQEREGMLQGGQDCRASGRCVGDSIPFFRQGSETSSRHNGHDKQLDCTVAQDEPSNTSQNVSSLSHKVIRARSGWAVHRQFRLRIGV